MTQHTSRILLALALASPAAAQALQTSDYLKADHVGEADELGFAVAVDGDTLVAGAPAEGSGLTGIDPDPADDSAPFSGAVYVKRRQPSGWIQEAYIKPFNTDGWDGFGTSIAIDGDYMVVGAPREDSSGSQNPNDNVVPQSGAAYVFVRNGSTWTQQAYLKASNPGQNYLFGWSVAISGHRIVVGSPGEQSDATGVNGNQSDDGLNNAGAAYAFVRNGTNWTQQAYLKASNTDVGDTFGVSVAIDGNQIIVGAYGEDSSSRTIDSGAADNSSDDVGAAYVFERAQMAWTQTAYLKCSNADWGDQFGIAVDIHGTTAVVGANLEDSGSNRVDGDQGTTGTDVGAAYVFDKTPAGWVQSSYLKASNAESLDEFGTDVAIHEDRIVVGTFKESSGTDDVNSHLDDNLQTWAGAAYTFVRCAGLWHAEYYLKASNSDAHDRFGSAVALGGDWIGIGAPRESSSGLPSSNDLPGAGAAYAFELATRGGCPGEDCPFRASYSIATGSFVVRCPTPTVSCTSPSVILFGTQSAPLVVPPPIGCAVCELLVSPSWGTAPNELNVGPGLPLGFEFFVQCGCVAGSCISLSGARLIVVRS